MTARSYQNHQKSVPVCPRMGPWRMEDCGIYLLTPIPTSHRLPLEHHQTSPFTTPRMHLYVWYQRTSPPLPGRKARERPTDGARAVWAFRVPSVAGAAEGRGRLRAVMWGVAVLQVSVAMVLDWNLKTSILRDRLHGHNQRTRACILTEQSGINESDQVKTIVPIPPYAYTDGIQTPDSSFSSSCWTCKYGWRQRGENRICQTFLLEALLKVLMKCWLKWDLRITHVFNFSMLSNF